MTSAQRTQSHSYTRDTMVKGISKWVVGGWGEDHSIAQSFEDQLVYVDAPGS